MSLGVGPLGGAPLGVGAATNSGSGITLTAALTGVGVLAGSASATSFVDGSVAGAATVTATATTGENLTAALTGVGVLAGSASATSFVDGSVAGAATVTATATTGGYVPEIAPVTLTAVTSVQTAISIAPVTILRAWGGSDWVEHPLRRWDGSRWLPVTGYRWDGAQWVLLPRRHFGDFLPVGSALVASSATVTTP